jgi:kynureninase
MTLTRTDAVARDANDPLAGFKARFALPAGKIYLGGNTLGAASHDSIARLERAAGREWATNLVSAWNLDDWIGLPRRIGDKIAGLVGAGPGEVVVTDSTTVNLFKLLHSARALRPDRAVILTDQENFPTDLYVIDSVAQATGCRVERAPAAQLVDAIARIGRDLAVVLATEVDYVSGARADIAAVNTAGHRAGALTLWDLSHSVGIVPVDLTASETDFAVGCTYKYLNGGPGAPAFLYVASRHQAVAPAVLPGWMGHARPFAFAPGYEPADGIARHLAGTPPILSMSALEPAVDLTLEAGMTAVRARSQSLTGFMIEVLEQECAAHGLSVMTPRDPERRGGHVAAAHPEGYAVMQALIDQGIVGDFRPPATMRFGLHPLYVGHADVWDTVAALRDILETRRYDRPQYRSRRAVT